MTNVGNGPNRLEIDVANLWPNRLIGDAGLPEKQRVTWTTWNPYRKDAPLLPSGWLGPIEVFSAGPDTDPMTVVVAVDAGP